LLFFAISTIVYPPGCAGARKSVFGIGDAYHRLEGRHFAAVSTIGD
jgi:hypothetical protein